MNLPSNRVARMPRPTRLRKSLSRSLPCAVAALGFVLMQPATAQTMTAAPADPFSSAEVSAPWMPSHEGATGRSREDVKEELARARATNTLSASSELGDTPDILQAREDFNALQTEVILAEQERAAEQRAKLQDAERLSQAMDAQEMDGQSTGIRLVADSGVTVQLKSEAEILRYVEDRLAAGHPVVLMIETEEDLD